MPQRALCPRLVWIGLAWLSCLSVVLAAGLVRNRDSVPFVLESRPPWQSCAYCHGESGDVSSAQVPAIAGQPRDYLVRQLRAFRAGRRMDPERLMWSAVVTLDEEDIPRVADYFASLTRSVQVGRNRGDDCAADRSGRRLFHRGRPGLPACIECHPAQAETAPGAGRPHLVGLHPDYLNRQLLDYATGRRGNDPLGVMRAIASRLSADEMRALSRYIAECLEQTDVAER